MSDFWDDGAGGGRVSVGLAVIMLLVDIVLYSIIAWYVDNVNPGPYGRAKPFYFMFQVKVLEIFLSNWTVKLFKLRRSSNRPQDKA